MPAKLIDFWERDLGLRDFEPRLDLRQTDLAVDADPPHRIRLGAIQQNIIDGMLPGIY